MGAMKAYHQYCPVAHALDQVGDRWELLIVRELMLGQRRYTDLAEALPGIGSNILATRLRDLEEAGVVRKTKLPPPWAVTVYELTERGRELDSVLRALAAWGARAQPAPVARRRGAVLGRRRDRVLGAPDGRVRLLAGRRALVLDHGER